MDYDESTTPQNKVLFISPTVLFSHGKDDSNAAAEVAVITVTVSKKKGKKKHSAPTCRLSVTDRVIEPKTSNKK